MLSLNVSLAERSYPILIGPGLLADGRQLAELLPARDLLLVSNTTVAPLYARQVFDALTDRRIVDVRLPDGEQYKTLESMQQVLDVAVANRFGRDCMVVALGGGVVGDLAGFAAACYQRGVAFAQIPTTLLAQVDSSVGGKTGVNHPGGKNMIGAFHQPSAVVADTTTLRTLPPRELRAGLAEVVKYGAIVDAPFLDWLEAQADALLAGDDAALAEAIARSCRHKAAIVERDPFEHGDRALLNFGHTFGHAIETTQGYGGLIHGEAVAVGMVQAARLSERLGLSPAADTQRLRALLQRFGLPVDPPPGLATDTLLGHMRLDKKAQVGGLRFIVWDGAGRARVLSDVPEADVRAVLAG